MSKNLTRKGLALAAIGALGASLFAGAPAYAAGVLKSAEIALAPAAGTTYNTLAQSTFPLVTKVDPTLKAAAGKDFKELSFLILNSSAKPLTVGFDGNWSSSALSDISIVSADSAADLPATAYQDTTGTVSTSRKAIALVGRASNTSDASDINNGKNTLTLGTTATDADVTVTVQAWLDDNNDGLIGAQEWTSDVRTIKFVQPANVVATTTVTSATVGATTIKGQVVIGNDINMANLPASSVNIQFKNNGKIVPMYGSSASNTTDSVDVAWDADAAALNNTVNTKNVVGSTDGADYVGAIQAGTNKLAAGTVVAQAYYVTAAGTVIAFGAASNASTSTAGTDASVDGTDVLKVTGSANATSGADASIRTGYQGDITFTSYVLSADAADTSTTVGKVSIVKVAGNKVKVTLTKSKDAFDAASTFTAGGVTLTATSGPVSFTVLSDADGKISFTGKGTGVKGDSVVVSIAALGTSGYKNADTNTITWVDAKATTLVATDKVGANAELKTTVGGTYNVNLSLVDQFGQLFTGVRRAKIDNNGGTAIFAAYPEFVGGKVSQAIVDNSTAAGTVTVRALVQKKNASTGLWETDIDAANVLTVNVNSKVASAVSASAKTTDAVDTITSSLVSANLYLDNNTATQTTIGYGATATQTISGFVTDASGAGVAGATVTVTGAGLAFVVDGKVYSVGSATVQASATGAYSVDVYSNASGAASVVVTSGAATKTVAIKFGGVTVKATTNVLTIDAPALSQVGRAVTVTVKIVDKFGNAVKDITPSVSVTGVGSITTAAATDKDGKTTVQFLAGANDFGDAVITAKYTASDDVTVVSATKTVTVGVTDAQVDIVKNRVTAVASFTKGRTVAFYVDGIKKWSKLSASDADVVLNYNLKKGTHTVTVKISGGFVTTEKYIVK